MSTGGVAELRKRLGSVAALLGIALVASGCGGTAAVPAAPAAAAKPAAAKGPLQPVTFRLAYIIEGYEAPYFLALERGYYRQAGIDLKIEQGRGSANTAEQVANGHDTFGEVDASTAALSIAKGLPIEMVDVLFQKSPMATIYLSSTRLSKPADLKQLTVAEPAGSGTATIWPIFLGLNHIAPSQVHTVDLNSNALNAALLDHKIQAFNSFSITSVPQLQAAGAKAAALDWADWGLDLMNIGTVTNRRTIEQDPKLVAAFVQATLHGWADAAKDPAAAAAALLKYYPKENAQVVRASVEQEIPLMTSPETQGHPLGWQSATLWDKTLAILSQSGQLKKHLPLASIYTNQFVGNS